MATTLTAPPSQSVAAAEITRLHSEVMATAKTTLEKAIRIGELLSQERARLKHGEWLPWVKANLPFSDRTAQNYLRVYRERDRIESESETVSDLTDAYRLLCAPNPQPFPSNNDISASNPTTIDISAEISVGPAINSPESQEPPSKNPTSAEAPADPEPEKETPRIQNADEELSRPKLEKVIASNGMLCADLAIMQLKKIDPSDTEREKAFDAVMAWISDQGVVPVDAGKMVKRPDMRKANWFHRLSPKRRYDILWFIFTSGVRLEIPNFEAFKRQVNHWTEQMAQEEAR